MNAKRFCGAQNCKIILHPNAKFGPIEAAGPQIAGLFNVSKIGGRIGEKSR